MNETPFISQASLHSLMVHSRLPKLVRVRIFGVRNGRFFFVALVFYFGEAREFREVN